MRAAQSLQEEFEFTSAYPGSWLFGTRLTFQGSGGDNNMSAILMTQINDDGAEMPRVSFESVLLVMAMVNKPYLRSDFTNTV